MHTHSGYYISLFGINLVNEPNLPILGLLAWKPWSLLICWIHGIVAFPEYLIQGFYSFKFTAYCNVCMVPFVPFYFLRISYENMLSFFFFFGPRFQSFADIFSESKFLMSLTWSHQLSSPWSENILVRWRGPQNSFALFLSSEWEKHQADEALPAYPSRTVMRESCNQLLLWEKKQFVFFWVAPLLFVYLSFFFE